MKKAILGVDMGHDRLKLVLMKGKKIMKTATVQINASDDSGAADL